MRNVLTRLALFSLFLAAIAARADEYVITISVANTQVADFTVTGETTSGLGFVATAIQGTDGGQAVTLLPNGDYYGNDSYFSTTSPFFTDGGLAFSTGSGNSLEDYSIYSPGVSDLYCDASEVCHSGDGVAATVTVTDIGNPPPVGATPEPSSLVLVSTGIFAVAGATRRRFRKV